MLAAPACGFTISTTPSAAPVTCSPTSTVRPVEVAEPVAETDDLSLDDAAALIRPYLLTTAEAGVDGISCGEGTVAGEPVAIAPAEDLTVDVGGEQATGWALGNEDFGVIIVTVRRDTVVWNFTYLAAGDTFDDLTDVLEVSAAGVAKFDG